MKRTEEYFTCECSSIDHVVRFMVDEGDDIFPPELYIEVQLHQWRGFFHRLWIATKYAFGYQCRGGHWDCTIFKDEDLPRMKKVFEQYQTFLAEHSDKERTLHDNQM